MTPPQHQQQGQFPPVALQKSGPAVMPLGRATPPGGPVSQPPANVSPGQSQPAPPPMEPLAPRHGSTRLAVTPPPPEPSPVPSDMGLPPLGRMPSNSTDNFSDTASVSTIEVSEAKTQPVLRPQVVQVYRRSTDLHQTLSGTQTPTPAPLAPLGGSRAPMNEPPIVKENAPSPFALSSQRQDARPEPTPFVDDSRTLTPAPLFSGPNSPNSIKNSDPSPKGNRLEPPAPKPQPPVDDKWAKKPAADYSGGDWGDEDDWDY